MVAHPAPDVRIPSPNCGFAYDAVIHRRWRLVQAYPARTGCKRAAASLCAEYVLKFPSVPPADVLCSHGKDWSRSFHRPRVPCRRCRGQLPCMPGPPGQALHLAADLNTHSQQHRPGRLRIGTDRIRATMTAAAIASGLAQNCRSASPMRISGPRRVRRLHREIVEPV
jgi:hypothetical protein